MAPLNLVFDHPLQDHQRRAQHAQGHGAGAKLPYQLAVPLIIAMSAGLWVGLWKLGSLMVGLIG